MEWYWIVLMLAAVAGIVSLLYVLRKKGVINHDLLSIMKLGLQMLKTLFKGKEQSPAVMLIAKVMQLVEVAMLMAEYLWYDGEIEYDQRYMKAKELLVGLLKDVGVILPDEADNLIDRLIEAVQKNAGYETYDDYAVALVMEVDVEEIEAETIDMTVQSE